MYVSKQAYIKTFLFKYQMFTFDLFFKQIGAVVQLLFQNNLFPVFVLKLMQNKCFDFNSHILYTIICFLTIYFLIVVLLLIIWNKLKSKRTMKLK